MEAATPPPSPGLTSCEERKKDELRRDLERYDLSIGSLQLKWKRLTEEREKCLTENERGASDLQRIESDRENRSVNASDSSDPEGDKSGENAGEKKHVVNPPEKPGSGEDSYNGSSDSTAMAKGSAKTEPVLVEERLETEASEVHSSASLSRKKGQRKSRSLKNSGEKTENQRSSDNVSGKLQPLADLLDMLRNHKFGSVLELPLDSQESFKYKNMIRQHMDLATVGKRLEEGSYSECHSKFYRDLLLLATNAILFFPKRSLEHKSAIELRQLVSSNVKKECFSADSPPLLTSPVIACRKRSSIVLKPSSEEKKPSWISTVTKKQTMDQSSENSEAKLKKKKKKKSNNNSNVETNGKSQESSARKGSSHVNAKEKGKQKQKEGLKTDMGRPPKRAAALAGTKKRRSDGGGDKPADEALPKKRLRK